jgi:cytochrome b involved in lipid metabolism
MAGYRQRAEAKQQEIAAKLPQLEWKGDIKMEEVEKHNTVDDLWVVLDGFVYDITKYLQYHPGGASCLVNANNMDITRAFYAVHRHVNPKMVERLKIGRLIEET